MTTDYQDNLNQKDNDRNITKYFISNYLQNLNDKDSRDNHRNK